ncbi:MAG TPA: citrate/2-methylcitrate synthase [Pyrinomonadaceae bacterium]|nr:citrate/2-methylcitrate synthase [Pyrinomonadaceae bacterium]
MDTTFALLPPAPAHNPVKQATARANELGEKQIATTLGYFATMPASTGILANPVLYHTPVDCNGTTITLDIRSFTIRGLIPEADIVRGNAGPMDVIFTGLFSSAGEQADASAAGSEKLAALIDEKYFEALGTREDRSFQAGPLLEQIAAFVKQYPGLGPEVAIQHFATLGKARLGREEHHDHGVHDDRDDVALLMEMITVHMQNVAVGGVSAYLNYVVSNNPQISTSELTASANEFISAEVSQGRNAFEISYSLILGRHANDHERLILERMGTIQIHHGSAGSSMVARYMATLHTLSVSDFFIASQMALDGARHFGAIHDMSDFVQELEARPPDQRTDRIREKMLGGGLPTFGHPEISAAGRGNQVQQDPRPAIYIDPVFKAIDAGQLTISPRQQERLAIARLIYLTAFVNGVLKPDRQNEPPLRLTANTDFGAWCVQEALGIEEADRTLLTYIFRGFGWMMDAREQLQQKMIRPVIAPDPQIIPKPNDDQTIPAVVERVHRRLTHEQPFSAQPND